MHSSNSNGVKSVPNASVISTIFHRPIKIDDTHKSKNPNHVASRASGYRN